MAEAERQRLFFALWPDADLRVRVAALRDRLAARVYARPVASENFHLTLAFLGSVAADQLACVEAAAAAVRGRGADLVLDRLGQFRRAQVGWLGASVVPAELAATANAVQQQLRDCEVHHEDRPWAAHLTLFRKLRRPLPPLTFEPLHWRVDRFVLVRSQTSSEGASYEVLREWPLG